MVLIIYEFIHEFIIIYEFYHMYMKSKAASAPELSSWVHVLMWFDFLNMAEKLV